MACELYPKCNMGFKKKYAKVEKNALCSFEHRIQIKIIK